MCKFVLLKKFEIYKTNFFEDINLLIIKQFAVFDVLIAVAVVEVVREKLKKIF